jgi:DNA-binding SARP family transcriptional activator
MITASPITLSVRCLGAFAFCQDGAWTSGPAFKRGREFLQYLVSYPRAAVSRSALAEAFWPELDISMVAHRLHIAVSGARTALRAVLTGEPFQCSGGTYGWNPAIEIDSDAERFLACHHEASMASMRDGIALYRGEYLAGEQAEWIYPLRVRYASVYATMLERLADDAAARHDHAAALDFGLRLSEADRAHEGAARVVMRAFAALGRRGAALAEYDALARYLQRYLGIDPSGTTRRLREEIVRGDS